MKGESIRDGWRITESEKGQLLTGHEMKWQYNYTAAKSLLKYKIWLCSVSVQAFSSFFFC